MSRTVRALFVALAMLATALSPAAAQPLTSTCGSGAPGLCLGGGRYRVEAAWHTPGTGARGAGHPVFLSPETGGFWFFNPDNLELMVKVLDGGGINGHTWVFYASLTDVEFELTVTDRITGERRVYRNPAGAMASQADTRAFPAPAAPLPDAPDPALFPPSRPLAAGPPFRLQDSANEVLLSPWLASTADGGFTAVWGYGDNHPWLGDEVGIASRSFPPAGPPGPEVPLSLRISSPSPAHPRVARSAQGALAIWGNFYPDQPSIRYDGAAAAGDAGTLSGRKLDASGQPNDAETLLAEPADSGDIAPAPDGGYVLVWSDESGEVYVRKLNADGQPVGAPLPLSVDDEWGYLPAVAPLSDGRFIVVWQQYYPAFPTISALARIVSLNAEGTDLVPQGSTIVVANGLGRHSHAFVSANATSFVVSWGENEGANAGRLLVRRYSPAGQPLGEAIVVRDLPATRRLVNGGLALRPDGSFLVVWTEADVPGFKQVALSLPFSSAGIPFGPPFRIRDEEIGPWSYAGGTAATPSGWVVSWVEGDRPWVSRIDSTCPNGALGLCLNGGRFRVEATWHVPATGARGTASPLVLSGKEGDSGALWFFDPSNYEMTVKVLDGRAINGHFWVFYASLTDVEFDLTVTDTVTGAQRTYHNPPGTMASRADTQAFPR